MLGYKKIRQNINIIPKIRYLLKRDLFILLAFIATPASGERRVTTTEGNALNSNTCQDETCYKKQPTLPQNIQIPKSWEKLLDPSQKEFWNEGNHTPDAGFVQWATHPTLDNAKLYLIRMNAKRDRLHLMAQQQEQANLELIKAGIIANDYDFLAQHFQNTDSQKSSQQKLDKSIGHIWFFFHPDCPHCHRQAQILAGNPNVVPMQVAGQVLHSFKGLSPTLWAEKEDIKRYVSDGSVPVLVIYNPKSNQLTTLKGVQSIASIAKVGHALGRVGKMEKKGAKEIR